MDLQPKSCEKIKQLIQRGVDIPNPGTVDVGDDVAIDQISGNGVRIYPGCRIYGSKTVISPGCLIGYEAPVTIDNCQLGSKVELKGGFFSHSVFLEKAHMGMGAHVREGCILEEQAGGAHCVGLKQTILFPFVTLGSLINFCDCLMAGGTSRSNHSEVGSAYIHFNFTPDADKSTPSLIGDVPRGVMLNQPPVFLGGHGGMVGPVRLGFGNVVAAGSILRHDYPQNHQLIFEKPPADGIKHYEPAAYPNLARILENNFLFLANLVALEAWYHHVRTFFMSSDPFGRLLFAAALEQLSNGKKERLKRLKVLAEKVSDIPQSNDGHQSSRERRELREQIGYLEDLFTGTGRTGVESTERLRESFLNDFEKAADKDSTDYITAIQSLPPEISSKGSTWLNGIVYVLEEKVSRALPSFSLFKKIS